MIDADQTLSIAEAVARRADAEAVRTLLQQLPQSIAEELRAQLAHNRGGFCAMRYHRETSQGFWIAADPQLLLCVTLPSLSAQQAAQIAEKIEHRRCSGDSAGVMAAYGEVTGSSLERITRH